MYENFTLDAQDEKSLKPHEVQSKQEARGPQDIPRHLVILNLAANVLKLYPEDCTFIWSFFSVRRWMNTLLYCTNKVMLVFNKSL